VGFPVLALPSLNARAVTLNARAVTFDIGTTLEEAEKILILYARTHAEKYDARR
jgi:hypothetical protein